MALRSLGSSILAKTSPGSQLRKAQEERLESPIAQEAEGAQLSSAQRQAITEPLEKQVPIGTQKVVSVQPMIEPTLKGTYQAPATGVTPSPSVSGGILPQMGGAAAAASTGRSIAAQPSVSSPISTSQKITSQPAKATSVSSAPNAGVAKSYIPTPTPTPTQSKAPAPEYQQTGFLSGILPTIASLGNRVAAEGGVQEIPRNFGQAVAGTVGKVIDTVGKALGNPLPEKNVSENLQKFASNVGATIKGVGSISNPAATVKAVAQSQPVQNVVRSVQKAVEQVTQKASNLLRSLFKK